MPKRNRLMIALVMPASTHKWVAVEAASLIFLAMCLVIFLVAEAAVAGEVELVGGLGLGDDATGCIAGDDVDDGIAGPPGARTAPVGLAE